MFTTAHTAVSIMIQKAFPGIAGILLCLPVHYAMDNINEGSTYKSMNDRIVFEFSLNLANVGAILAIEDEKKRNDYLLSVIMGNIPDVPYQLFKHQTHIFDHYKTPFDIKTDHTTMFLLHTLPTIYSLFILNEEIENSKKPLVKGEKSP